MRFGSVCSGIEAASVAWHPLGWKAAWLSEIEPFPSAVLAHHYPDVPNLGDMTKLPELIDTGLLEAPDVFCGGTPCQAFSVAGLRKSLDDARGNLSLTFCEIANAIDNKRIATRMAPTIIFWENVPGVLSTKDNAFGCFLGALAGENDPIIPSGEKWTNAGCVYGPQRTVAWRVLDAKYFGVAQRRRRVFVVASARDDFDPAAVLFEFNGVRRDIAPSREKRESAASYTPSSFGGYSQESGTLRANGGDLGGGSENLLIDKQWPSELSSTLDTTFGTKMGLENQHVNAGCPMFVPAEVTTVQTLRAKRPGEGGMSHDHEHIVPVLSPALNTQSGANHAPDTKAYVVQPIALAENTIGRKPENGGNGDGFTDGDPMYTLNATGVHGVAQPIPIDTMNMTSGHSSGGLGFGQPGDPSFTLTKGHSHAVAQSMAVRRLTPTECERLQGFPDSYTNIPWRKKPASECPDGPRYKALGNSWAVPVVRWIGKRIQEATQC